MTVDDLQTVLGWAAAEGWNPGDADARPFLAADPSGFLLKTIDDQPVAAISVVNHDEDFAFLGLYLCLPEFRGQGHGIDVWRAGLRHAGDRCIGLEGVPDQQANYAKSGFSRQGQTVRFEGTMEPTEAILANVAGAQLDEVIRADQEASGFRRQSFARVWFAGDLTRTTLGLWEDDMLVAFACYRQCGTGLKIGPLHAQTKAQAEALIAARPDGFHDGPVFIDVPDHVTALTELLVAHGFDPVFSTARMYSAPSPNATPPRFYAIATMELG